MRNTICATLTAITLTLCTALAGCGSASEPAAPAHAGPDYRTTRSLAPRLLSSSPGLGVRP